jgi:hypothetical protein
MRLLVAEAREISNPEARSDSGAVVAGFETGWLSCEPG